MNRIMEKIVVGLICLFLIFFAAGYVFWEILVKGKVEVNND